MARTAKHMASIMTLLTSMAAAVPALAVSEAEYVLDESRRLNKRMAQVEEDNRHPISELAASEGRAREKEILGRQEDVESQAISQDRKPRLLEEPEGVSVEASLLMVGQRALSGTASGKDGSRINYRADTGSRQACA